MDIKNILPPKANEVPFSLRANGEDRIDPYYWLRDRENPEVIAYLKAENDYCDQVMKPTETLQEALFQEITGRIKEDDDSVPYFKNGYWYYYRYQKGMEYPVYGRKVSLEAPEEVLLDVNELAKNQAFYQVGAMQVSADNQWLAYSEDTQSRRIYTLRFKNLQTGETLEEKIEGISGGMTWANDNQTIFYTQLDQETLRPFLVKKHVLGTDPKLDEVVYEELDNTFRAGVSKTKNGKFLLIGSFATLTNEYRFLPADQPSGDWKIFEPRNRGEKLEYFPDQTGDFWYIRTNKDAHNFCIMRTPLDQTSKENWEVVVPGQPDVLIEEFDLFAHYLVVTERKAGITGLRVFPFSGDSYEVTFGEDARMVHTVANREIESHTLRFAYQSMTTPSSIFDFDMATRERTLMKQDEVLGGFTPDNYRSERIMVRVRDGVLVPVSLVYHKAKKVESGNPLLLYGYGSYGISLDPYFSAARLSLLDRGFVFAIAHIRGGEEMGRSWYENGKLLHKKNTFFDFIDVAEFLVKNHYVQKDKLFAMGGSAGGLLVGVVMNMRPDLWKGIIAAVPFVDVLNTMLDDTIPLTTGEYDEWGNPADPEYYHYIKSYSPYDNIQPVEYPNLLVTTGIHDSQVQYWEPAKWVARLRKEKKDKNLLLLRTNLETGHTGESGRFERFRETALDYAFLISLAENNL